jgi:hypothetical protein
MEATVPAPLHQHEQQAACQSVWAPDHTRMLRTVTAIQQFMAEFNDAVSEVEKTVVTTNIVLNLMKQNDP